MIRKLVVFATLVFSVCAIPGKRHLHLQTMVNGLKAEIKAEGKVTPKVQEVFDTLVDEYIPRLKNAIEKGFNDTQALFHSTVNLLQAWAADTNFTKKVANTRTDLENKCNQEIYPLQCKAVQCRVEEDYEVKRCCQNGRGCGVCPCEPEGNQNRTWTYNNDIFGDKICDMFEAPQCEQCNHIHDLKSELVRVGSFLFEFYANFSLQQKQCIIYRQNLTDLAAECASDVVNFDEKIDECNDLTSDANTARCRFGSWLQEKCVVYDRWVQLVADSKQRLGGIHSEVDRHYEWDTINTIECFIKSYSSVTLNFTDFDPACVDPYNASYHLNRRESDVQAALNLAHFPFQDCVVTTHTFGEVQDNTSVLPPNIIVPPGEPNCQEIIQVGLSQTGNFEFEATDPSDCDNMGTQPPTPSCPALETAGLEYEWARENHRAPYVICQPANFGNNWFKGTTNCHPTQLIDNFEDCQKAASELSLPAPTQQSSDQPLIGCSYNAQDSRVIFNSNFAGEQKDTAGQEPLCAYRQLRRWSEYLDEQTCDPKNNLDFSASTVSSSSSSFVVDHVYPIRTVNSTNAHLKADVTRMNKATNASVSGVPNVEVLNGMLKIPFKTNEVTTLKFSINQVDVPYWTLTFMDFDSVVDSAGVKFNERITADLTSGGHANFEQARNGLKVRLDRTGDAPTGHWTFDSLPGSVANAADPQDAWALTEDQKDRSVAFKGQVQTGGALLTVQVDFSTDGEPSTPVTGYLLVAGQTSYQCVRY